MNKIRNLIHSLTSSAEILVHIGAGECTEHDVYQTVQPQQLVYLEPDQLLAEAAEARFKSVPNVKVVSNAISSECEKRTLHITNNRRFSSLLELDKLLDYYPNVEVVDNLEIEAITLSKLCLDEAIDSQSNNLLIAEMRGMERSVFTAVESEVLRKFKWVIIRSSDLNLYQCKSTETLEKLGNHMRDAGFTVLKFAEDAPPFVNLMCIRDDSASRADLLELRETELLDNTKNLEQRLSEQMESIELLNISHASAMNEIQEGLTAKDSELVKVNKQIQTLNKSKVKQQDLIEKVSAELRSVKKLNQTLTTDIGTQHKQREKLAKDLETRSTELSEAQSQIESLTKDIVKRQKQHEALEGDLETTSTDLATAKSQIELLKDDIGKLQRQYKELSKESEQRSADLATAQSSIKSLTSDNDKLRQQSEQLSIKLEDKAAELASGQVQTQELIEEQEKQLARFNELRNKLDNKSKELTSAETRIQEINNEKAKQQDQIENLTKDLKTSSSELISTQENIQAQTQKQEKQQTQIEELSKIIETKSAEVEAVQLKVNAEDREKTQQKIDALENLLKEKAVEIANMQQTVRMNNKLLLKSDADLRDLQIQYRAAMQHQEQQHVLLNELKANLKQASIFYQKLNLSKIVIDGDLLEKTQTSDDQ